MTRIVLIAALVALAASSAHADDILHKEHYPFNAMVVYGLGPAINAGGLAALVGASVQLAGPGQPSRPWLITSYIMGGFNMVLGGGMLIMWTSRCTDGCSKAGLGWGVATTLLGVTDLALGVTMSLRRMSAPKRISSAIPHVSPLMLTSPQGELVGSGLNFTWTGF